MHKMRWLCSTPYRRKFNQLSSVSVYVNPKLFCLRINQTDKHQLLLKSPVSTRTCAGQACNTRQRCHMATTRPEKISSATTPQGLHILPSKNSKLGTHLEDIQCYCLFTVDLSFLFLNIHFEFAAEIFGGCTNIPCEHTQFCVQFLEIVNFEFFDSSMWSTLRGGSTRYLLNPSIPWRGAFVRIFAGGHIGLCRWLFTVTIGDPQDRSLLAKKASLQNVILSLDRHLAKTPATWRCRFRLVNFCLIFFVEHLILTHGKGFVERPDKQNQAKSLCRSLLYRQRLPMACTQQSLCRVFWVLGKPKFSSSVRYLYSKK